MTKAEHLMIVGAREAGYKNSIDFYETPPIATKALIDSKFLSPALPIWEPACGRGAISEVLEAHNFEVVSTDIVDHGYDKCYVLYDFLKMEFPSKRPYQIVTNPPYNLAPEFVEQACRLVDKSAFLLRLAFLEGQKRKLLFQRCPLCRILVFSKRLPRMHRFDYEGKKTSSTIAFAWFLFDTNYTGSPTIEWV